MIPRIIDVVLAGGLVLTGAGSTEAHCSAITHEQMGYVICEAFVGDDLRLFLNDQEGRSYGSFNRIDAALAQEGERLGFAMNAGMYHRDRRPVGLYVEDGIEHSQIVTSPGPGNFGMLPNGVFCINDDSFQVLESRMFAADPPDCKHATQSGPMLVIDGSLHPRFLSASTSRFVRNGVGVTDNGARAVFAISDGPVTFYEFAGLFRDHLGARDALYLDGNVSRLHATDLGRSDWGLPMGPVLGLVVKR